jgi:hypothetical protein
VAKKREVLELASGELIGQVLRGVTNHPYYDNLVDQFGMPSGIEFLVVVINDEAVVGRFGKRYQGYTLQYLGISKDSSIETGASIQTVGSKGEADNIAVWASLVRWQEFQSAYVVAYRAAIKTWQMFISGIHLDPPQKRAAIVSKLAAAIPIARAQFEETLKGKREDDIPIDVFRERAFQDVERLAGRGGKLSKQRLGAQMKLNRDTVSKYLLRDPRLWGELQTEFMKIQKG